MRNCFLTVDDTLFSKKLDTSTVNGFSKTPKLITKVQIGILQLTANYIVVFLRKTWGFFAIVSNNTPSLSVVLSAFRDVVSESSYLFLFCSVGVCSRCLNKWNLQWNLNTIFDDKGLPKVSIRDTHSVLLLELSQAKVHVFRLNASWTTNLPSSICSGKSSGFSIVFFPVKCLLLGKISKK